MDETNTPLDYHIRVKPNSWLNNEWTWVILKFLTKVALDLLLVKSEAVLEFVFIDYNDLIEACNTIENFVKNYTVDIFYSYL